MENLLQRAQNWLINVFDETFGDLPGHCTCPPKRRVTLKRVDSETGEDMHFCGWCRLVILGK